MKSFYVNATDYDWFHNNSVWYDAATNSLTLSGRHQDAVVNLDYSTNEINWIVGSKEGWSKEMQKYFFEPDENTEFQWSQHAAMILPNGDLFVFDNGADRNRMNVLQHVLLFTGLGIFSYWLLADYTELTTYIYETTTFVGALATTVILFNIFGFSVLFFSNWLMAGYPLYYVSKSRLTLNYVIVGAVLLAMNFAIFFCLKFIGGSETVFSIKARGLTLIFFIWFIEIVVITMMLFTNSMRYTMDLYRRNKQLEADSVKAHYAALQQQLNPHFLFNSLNTLVAEIEYDPPTAVEFTRMYS